MMKWKKNGEEESEGEKRIEKNEGRNEDRKVGEERNDDGEKGRRKEGRKEEGVNVNECGGKNIRVEEDNIGNGKEGSKERDDLSNRDS